MGNIIGVELAPLKEIYNSKGNILHALKSSENSFSGFGEAYFSKINFKDIKGWKKHLSMTLNIIVPIGVIKFVLFDDRESSSSYKEFMEILVGNNNYQRLTVPPGIYVAFQGISNEVNMLLNIANIEHDPLESVNLELHHIEYNWA